MRKLTTALCGAVLAVALAAGSASAAGKAGIGLEWGYLPTIQMGAFGMDASAQEFTLAWDVSDSFQVGVFRSAGSFRGSHSYTDTAVTPNIDHEVSVTLPVMVSGLRFMSVLPMMNNMISLGVEAGTIKLGPNTAHDYTNSDGTAGVVGDFFDAGPPAGVQPENLDTSSALIGVAAKVRLIEAKGKNVTTGISVSGALRFVDLPDTYVFGSSEENTSAVDQTKIEPVSAFTNVAIGVLVGLWF